MLEVEPDLPILRAIILDFSSVNNVDITSVQHLIDVRNQLDRYAAPEKVDWHIACINNRWTKRALASAGFGYPTPPNKGDEGSQERWKPIFSVAELGGLSSAAQAADVQYRKSVSGPAKDVEAGNPDAIRSSAAEVEEKSHSSSNEDDLGRTLSDSKAYRKSATGRVAVVNSVNLPLFHIDLTSALQSAVANVKEGKSV